MTTHIIPGDGDRNVLHRPLRALCGAIMTHTPEGEANCVCCISIDMGESCGLRLHIAVDDLQIRTVQVTRAGGGVDIFTGATMVVGEEDVLHVLSIPDAIVREKYAHDEWRHADLYQGPDLVHRAVNPR